MKLYCKNGVVIATHDDNQDVPALAYGEGTVIVTRASGTNGLDRVGAEPAEGQEDTRPYAQPTEPTLSLDDQKAEKLAALAARRYEIETGGITVQGVPVKTDRESSAILTSARVLADRDPAFVVSNWKVDAGVFVTLDAPMITAISDAVTAHVQGTFNREAELSAAIIAAKTAAKLAAIDIDAGWPA